MLQRMSDVFHIFESYLPPLTGLRVLDVAARLGRLSIEFAKRGAEVRAAEQSPYDAMEAARALRAHGVDKFTTHALSQLLPYGEFDVVCFIDGMAGEWEPPLAANWLHHLTKCGGLALLSVAADDAAETSTNLSGVGFTDVCNIATRDDKAYLIARGTAHKLPLPDDPDDYVQDEWGDEY